jgi:recombination protein RecA
MSARSAKRKVDDSSTVEEVAAELQRLYGKQILFKASDPRFRIRRISTRIPTLDRILGGGVAIGRTTEFYGPFSAGKSLAVWYIIAEAQENGMLCALAATEKSFDPTFVKHIGVDLKTLVMIGDTEKGEQLVDYMEILLRSHKFGVIALDSVAALMPKAELEKTSEESVMGRMGQLTSRMMRKLTAVNTGGTALLITNQVRDAIGIMFGNPERPTGGKAIGHYASQRVEFRQGESITKQKQVIIDGKPKSRKVRLGTVVRVRTEKDKTGPNMGRDSSFKYYTRSGRVDIVDSVVQLGIEDGLVEVHGNRLALVGGKPIMRKAFIAGLRVDGSIDLLKLSVKVARNHTATMGGDIEDGSAEDEE